MRSKRCKSRLLCASYDLKVAGRNCSGPFGPSGQVFKYFHSCLTFGPSAPQPLQLHFLAPPFPHQTPPMANTLIRTDRRTILVLLLAISLSKTQNSCLVLANDLGIASGGASGRAFGSKKDSNRAVDCREFSSRSQCLQSNKCSWCRSDAIDDMCFSSYEAWRLPQQVFSCD
ncbi:hypothetical protein Scep_027815 [Stephania cephalantha]|uniref:Uncharacterized protein n=1 Tax=Stephania cephalantha TaxID=152367 RepID=A0AAP0EG49_9MAGN